MTPVSRSSLAELLAYPLAALFGISSLVGVLRPDIAYRNETPLWTAQGVGQDWVDLFVVVPLIVWSAARSRRGSRTARMVLGGALIYSLYSLVLYAFAVHFNPLFLIYCGGLGLSFYAVLDLVAATRVERTPGWFVERGPAKATGLFIALLGVAFYALWLSDVVPALLSATTPKAIIDAGLITNPVHVLDLSIVLPAFLVAGISLYRRRALGYFLGPMLLAFGVIMDLALAGMAWSMAGRKIAGGGPPVAVFIGMAIVTAIVLWRFLRHMAGEERHTP